MSRRQQAAQERAKREREARVEQALKRLPELAQIKAKRGKQARGERGLPAPTRKRRS
jgi:hypothetical protein